jgi:hypothetical protein
MATYTKNQNLIETIKNEINVIDEQIPNYKPKNIYIFPGGGVSAVLYTYGVYKALHAAGLLLDDKGDLNKDNVFIGSSGGTIPGFLIMTIINLKLHKEPNWFETYVDATMTKIKPLLVGDIYVSFQIQSFITEQLTNCFLDDLVYTHLQKSIDEIIPIEFKGKLGIDFMNSDLNNYFKFNYVIVKNGNIPYMTDNFKDISGMTVIDQFKTVFQSCCTINGLSYTRFFQNHDAGTLITNYINCISTYLDNPYIRNLFYYTLTSYDDYSYKKVNYKNTLNYKDRDESEANYFLIHNIEQECNKLSKNFCLVNPPNKFNTLQKFDIPLYNELQQRIYYEDDFVGIEKFLGFYSYHNGPDMRKAVTLFGYYEALYSLKEINLFNKKKQISMKNVKYDVLSNSNSTNLFNLNAKEIKDAVFTIKYSIIESCFTTYNGDKELSAKFLIEYLTMMQGYDGKQDLNKKYQELYPIQTGNKKIWKNPEKYLSKEYKRVSQNIVDIYMPNSADKIKNMLQVNL